MPESINVIVRSAYVDKPQFNFYLQHVIIYIFYSFSLQFIQNYFIFLDCFLLFNIAQFCLDNIYAYFAIYRLDGENSYYDYRIKNA